MKEITAVGSREPAKAINTSEPNNTLCFHRTACHRAVHGFKVALPTCNLTSTDDCYLYLPISEVISRQSLMEWLESELDKESEMLDRAEDDSREQIWAQAKRIAYRQVLGADVDGEFAL